MAALLLVMLAPATDGSQGETGPRAAAIPTTDLESPPAAVAAPVEASFQAGSSGSPDSIVVADRSRLTATFNSIGVELPFSGDANGNATAGLEFRPLGDRAWRSGLPLWRTADPSGSAFYGSALLLEPATTYEIRITVADGDGVVGTSQETATIATRVDAIAPPEALTPSHYVRADGDDAADGLSPASAWRTIDKAVRDGPAGAIVQVGPGFYPTARAIAGRPNTARATSLTLVAEHPAVGADRQPTDAGGRSVIEPLGVSSPSGSTDGPRAGVWTQVILTGPKTGASYTVWKWSGSPAVDAMQLGYAGRRADSPIRVANWAKDKSDLATPAGWAEKLYTNLTYNFGFFSDGPDIYLRLPGDRDPNSLYVTASGANQAGLAINGPDLRLSGFEVRQFTSAVEVLSQAQRAIIDRCLLSGNHIGVAFKGERSAPDQNGVRTISYGSDHVVQDNLILDSSLRSAGASEAADGSMIPWMFVKTKIREADGSDYAGGRSGSLSESSGVHGLGGAQRVVVRRNTIDGPFNGVGTGYNYAFDRYAAQDMDVYDNLIRHIADDAIEPEFATINFRAWNNRIERALTVLSTGPVTFGPIYLFRNIGLQIGNEGDIGDGQGRVPGSTMFKYSGRSTPVARVYVLHNTFWTGQSVDGGAQAASSGPSPEAFYLRNNLIRAGHYAFEVPRAAGAWDEDANYLVTIDPARGLAYNGTTYRANVQAYRDASGQGARTNTTIGFSADVPLVDPAAGDLRLPPDSPLIDAGVPVPNISDRAGIDFQGAAPDIGYELR